MDSWDKLFGQETETEKQERQEALAKSWWVRRNERMIAKYGSLEDADWQMRREAQ